MIVRALAVAAAVLVPAATADSSATRIVDRTFSCESGYIGGLHQVDLGVQFVAQSGSSRLQPSASLTRNMWEAALGHLTPDGLSVHRQRCMPSTGSVKLTTTDMRGGAVPPLGAAATCETPRRLLLRVRASFTGAATSETNRQFGFPQLVVRGQVQQAAVAVGTSAGKPIAYVSLTKGAARLFTVRACKED